MKFWVFLMAALGAAYVIYQNAKVNPQLTRIDGWESTAKNRRPDMPSPAIGDPTPMYAQSES